MAHSVQVPKLRRHPKGSVVVLDGRYVYCGPYGSTEARQMYDRLIAEWLANGRRLSPPKPDNADITIEELLAADWRHVEAYYRKNGEPTSEVDTIRQALRFVRRLYGPMAAKDFTPLCLKTVRPAMIDHQITRIVKDRDRAAGKVTEVTRVLHRGLARRFINKPVARIKRMFGWAVENCLVLADTGAAVYGVWVYIEDDGPDRGDWPDTPLIVTASEG
jgi:hypothetical protein